ncbi:MAG: thymidine phosphorylase [Bacilli bacterium]|nr:thymidine phosphorylase [Bacilli bacterium]MDD4808824.1 thymidine phosphorylase [Bacilli bacterium]
MNIVELINKKRTKKILTKDELSFIINGYLNDEIKDYQISALLMAICLNGMTDEEIYDLTNIMLHSGDIIDLSGINKVKVDKHSTGGVGDKTTLIIAPLVASCGVVVPKMSGRSLGHTGGTIDKLESIKGFKTNLSRETFIKQVNDIGVSIISQTGNLVPADKKIYALRDVTGTVESIPLIASSIMSKKLACSADKIVLDVKVGQGALMKNLDDASKLGELMVKIGNNYGVETIAILSNMDQPLGYAIGNGLEVLESIDVLKGNGPSDLVELVIELASHMVSLGKKITFEEAKLEVQTNLNNGLAYQKFEELVNYQHGDINNISISSKVVSIKSNKTGFINKIDALKLGEIVRQLGAGRYHKDDVIDYGVGILLNRKVGDYILDGEELLKVYISNSDIQVQEIFDCFEIIESLDPLKPLIYKVIK